MFTVVALNLFGESIAPGVLFICSVIDLVIFLSLIISILKFKSCLKPVRLFFKKMSKVGVYEPSQEQDSMKTLVCIVLMFLEFFKFICY